MYIQNSKNAEVGQNEIVHKGDVFKRKTNSKYQIKIKNHKINATVKLALSRN